MTGSIRIFEKSNFTPKLSVLVFLKVKLPNMTDWHIMLLCFFLAFLPKWPFLTFLRNMTSNFEFLNFQNTRIS